MDVPAAHFASIDHGPNNGHGIEVDFLAVGEESKCGDAIAIRYGNFMGPRSEQTVVVVDGGTMESGEKLIEHIRQHYGTDQVDYVFATHSDNDHVSGLRPVVEEMDVRRLLMHRPWCQAQDICDLLKAARISPQGMERKLEKSLQTASELEDIAARKKITIEDPFTGWQSVDGVMHVLGPSMDYYHSLVPQFRRMPEAEPTFLEKAAEVATGTIERAVDWISETFHLETLDDSGETSAENNSSVILHVAFNGNQVLLTGDAGIPALTAAADYAGTQAINLSSLWLFQVPHHGSKRNVGPTLLNRIKAPNSFISAAKESRPKHPSQRVINALIRREHKVYCTQGIPLLHQINGPLRAGYGPVAPLDFVERFED